MKASYLIIVLLWSDITLKADDIPPHIVVGGSVVVLAVSWFVLPWPEHLLNFDCARLKTDLDKNLYGQPIASDVILKAVPIFIWSGQPTKQLALSFHGTTGVGKNHVAKIIARNIFQKGENSRHYITFIPGRDFPHKDQVDNYIGQLKRQIGFQIGINPLTMFVFDEMDKMHPQLVEAIQPFLNNVPYVDKKTYHRAIFIFLSNAGGNMIANTAVDFWSTGKNREEIRMNTKGMDAQIYQSMFSHESSGFWQLVDHFVPFLPLERQHIRRCVVAEMASLEISVDKFPDLVDKVVKEMIFFPPRGENLLC